MRRLVIATTLVACLTLAAQANAAAPQGFYGVVAAKDPDGSEIARMGAGRVGTLRIGFNWGTVQPTASSPLDFSHYDLIIGAAALQGIRVLPTVGGPPAWVSSQANIPPSRPSWGAFRAFVQAAAQRYGSNGTFWSANPSIPKLPVTYWQFWNEMNSPSFWAPKPSPKRYVQLLKVFHRGIKAGDRAGKVVLGGMFRTPNVRNGVTLDRYLPGIYKAKGQNFFEAAALHPYAFIPKNALIDARDTRKIMARFKDQKAKLWITEVGWATGGEGSPLIVSPEVQASYLNTTFRLLAKARKRTGIAGVLWYSFRDLQGRIWFNHTGLFNEDFTPKPSWSAFVSLTGGSP
jgi:polysaccharide biosynthesis protein PslG